MTTRPPSLSLVIDDRATSPVAGYAAHRFVEQLRALSGTAQTWILPAKPGDRIPPYARAWSFFDAHRAKISGAKPPEGARIPDAEALSNGKWLTEIISKGEKPDFIFVHSADAETLGHCARHAKRGAFEFRHAGIPLAALSDLGWSEVLERRSVMGFDLCLLGPGETRGVTFGPWEARTDRASPALTAKTSIDGCGLFLKSALAAFSSDARRAALPHCPAQGNSAKIPDGRRAHQLFHQFALRKIAGRLRHARVKNSQWGIGLIPKSSSPVDPLRCDRPPLDTQWLAPGPHAFWADPFVVDEQDRTYLLFEELPFDQPRGVLYAAELLLGSEREPEAAPHLENRIKILEKDFHLSFPFCFRHGGEIYLLPEQATSGRVQAYRARKFPDQWEDGPVLLPDFPGIDNVLLEHENRWWLFTTSAQDGNHDNHLMLFHSPSPFGPFEPHGLNPIRLGLAGSRMGGAIVKSGGKLFRPAQNCSRGYGKSLIFFEIQTLSETDYRERQVNEIFPDPGSLFPDALHSWNSNGRQVVIDGQRDLARW